VALNLFVVNCASLRLSPKISFRPASCPTPFVL
jgi:hypothetical protein